MVAMPFPAEGYGFHQKYHDIELQARLYKQARLSLYLFTLGTCTYQGMFSLFWYVSVPIEAGTCKYDCMGRHKF